MQNQRIPYDAVDSKSKGLMMNKLAKEQAEIFRVFSNPKRIMIFWLLADGPISVNELAEILGTSIQNVSQHLRLMKTMKILDTDRDGQSVYYRIADTQIAEYCREIHQTNLEKIYAPED